ncbi:response regulator transcription factor [Cohnella boryungensis]|uniref:Response regulator n=1 Tax=Cohnella boryungensis TaxID=768479 RepID=A0ABV8S9D7_9BACL
MVNVLIVDDEEPVREAIRILGEWSKLGVTELWEATDGRMALDKLADLPVDLAIVDMKMPELNGAELLRLIEQQYPELLVIVISGYNDFEYTRQAIRSKVVDYLLKPINREDLNQALRKAIHVLDARREMASESIHKNITLNLSLPKLKEKIYLSLLERGSHNPLNDTLLPLIGADNPSNRFAASVIRLMNMGEVAAKRFQRDFDLLHFAVANVMNDVAGEYVQCFSMANPKQEREIVTVMTSADSYREEMSYRADHLLKKAARLLDELFGLKVITGLGTICEEVAELAVSYESARTALNGIDLLKMPLAVAAVRADISAAHDSYSLVGRLPLIRSALESGNVTQAKSILSDFIGKWKSAEGLSIGQADRALQEFIILMNDLALELKVSAERLPLHDRLYPALREAGIDADFFCADQYEALMLRILEYYGNEIRRALTSNRPFEVGDIKAYIDAHYFEDIKISMFTEKYFLSREYLMKLFKQQFGFGIHEYVQKIRMDKAKQLLDDPALKIQEIAAMLGYKDKNYFSKAFRNYYSVSPSEYRDSLGKG